MAYIRTHDATLVASPDSPKAGVNYTCPMHPQIRQMGPGNCPICGMTLEPVQATAEVGENRDLVDMTRRISTWIQFVLSTPVVLWAGWPFFEGAWASVVHRSLNMFSLIALGTGAAYVYSLFATFAPGMFPA